VIIVAVLAVGAWRHQTHDALWGGVFMVGPWALHPLVLLYVLSGSLMISKTLRIPKF
jgi:CDP-diacylglycerol--serine O-phosphatidyltransferase